MVRAIIHLIMVLDVMVSHILQKCRSHTFNTETGYNLMTCIDVDECAESTVGCAQTCSNVPGSYFCSCESGYRLTSDRLGCVDIDECAGNGLNNCSQTCTNSVGSYNCSCRPGYRLASDGHACDGEYLMIIIQLVHAALQARIQVSFR